MIRCFELSINAPQKSGVRIITAVGPSAYTKDPVAKVLRSWYNSPAEKKSRGDMDLSYHMISGNEFKPIYDTESAKNEIGFTAQVDFRKEMSIE